MVDGACRGGIRGITTAVVIVVEKENAIIQTLAVSSCKVVVVNTDALLQQSSSL